MKGSLSHELATDIAAADLWEIYGTLRVGQLVPQLAPHIISNVQLIEGDGGVGTILQVSFPPGIPGLETYKEQFIKVDNENYTKEAKVIDGDLLKLGFLSYLVRFEIIGKGPDSSVLRSTIEYEFDDENANLESMVSTAAVAAIAEAITKYIKEQKSPQTTS